MNRLWMIIAVGVSAGVLTLAYLLGVGPKLEERELFVEQAEAAEELNMLHELRLTQLRADHARLDEFRAELVELQKLLPPGDDLPTFVGLLYEIEQQSEVLITRITPSQAVPFRPAPSAPFKSPLLGDNNLILLPIEIVVEGERDGVWAFVHGLQFGERQRLFLVRDLSINHSVAPGTAADYSGLISGYVYVLVDPSAPPPAVTPPQSETDAAISG